MRILLLTSTKKNPAFESTLADVAVRNHWTLTVIRPGSNKVIYFLTFIFGLTTLALMIGCYFLLRVLHREPLWVLISVLFALATLLSSMHWGVSRYMTMHQMRSTVRMAHTVVVDKKPNMIVALGYGCVVVLENEILRQLPLLMLSPTVTEYSKQLSIASEEQTLLNLEDSPFTYVTYDTTQSPATIRDSMILADTAEPGKCATDLLCVRYVDDFKLERLISLAFIKGWNGIAAREGVRIEHFDRYGISSADDEAAGISDLVDSPRIHIDDELCEKSFFKGCVNGQTKTDWLSPDDLRVLLQVPPIEQI